MPLLEVSDLRVEYQLPGGSLRAVESVSFALEKGETMGIVGESGCGKSTLMKALLKLLPANARVTGGSIRFKGQDLVPLRDDEMRRLRWKEIAYVPQSALNALNPVYRIGDQIAEAIVVHQGKSRKEAWERAKMLFNWVGLEAKRLHAYPHQLSGGMRQRSMIAMALALEPELLVADEPTTALDVVVQDRILRRLMLLQRQLHLSLVLVTHDISVVAKVCDRALVMYAGRVAELGSTRQIFKAPFHPYTIGLLNAFPNVKTEARELISIPGYPPDLSKPVQGCAFAPRCPFAVEVCHQVAPAPVEVEPGHVAACHRLDHAEAFRDAGRHRRTWEQSLAARSLATMATPSAPSARKAVGGDTGE